MILLGGALGVAAAWQAAPGGSARIAAVGLTVAALLALLGCGTGLGRGGLTGAACTALAVGAWELGLALTTPPVRELRSASAPYWSSDICRGWP
ncbi:hypothetical protein PQR15_19675 [Streptomyces lydicus]|nr:hypothetical protein [Streptomyces lydicus]